MAKVFKAGDMVIAGLSSAVYLIPDQAAVKDLPSEDSVLAVFDLATGDLQFFADPQYSLQHCVKIKGFPAGKFPTPTYSWGVTPEPESCDSQNKNPDEPLSCEREVNHPGDHMAWESYPHIFYQHGVWKG